MPARLTVAAAVVASAGLAGAGWALLAPIRLGSDAGDWRGASAGLHRSRPDGSLRGGPRAVIRLRDLHGGVERLELRLSAVGETEPVRISVVAPGAVSFAGALTPRIETVPVALPPGLGEAEVRIEAASLFLVHEISVVGRGTLWSWVGILLAPLLGVTALWLLWPREGPAAATAAGLVAAALVVGLWVALVEPRLALRFRPVERERLCLGLLAGVWGLALWRPRLLSAPAVVVTVGILYVPTLSYGFVYDDFVFARPWSWGAWLSTLAGSWDPSGLSTDYFRPLVSGSLALDYAAFGPWPPGFHLTNLVLHALLGCFVLLLLRRLEFSPRGSLAGVLAWLVHPLGATAAAWVNERTDSLASLFFVAALLSLLAAELRPLAVITLYVLALGSKELSVTWPVVAALALMLSGPREGRAERFKVVRLAALITLAYAALWVALFPGRILGRVGEAQAEAGLAPGAGWKTLPAFFATLFAPVDYVSWWQTPLRDTPVLRLSAGLLLPLLVSALVRRCASCGRARLLLLGVAWSVVTALPLLGMSGLDVYGKGLLVCVGFGIVWGALIGHVEHRSVVMAVALALVPVVWLAPLARASSAAWGPGGFFWERNMRWTRNLPGWKAGLTPEMRELFREQMEAAVRDERWVRSGR